jgi:hypothetical protein
LQSSRWLQQEYFGEKCRLHLRGKCSIRLLASIFKIIIGREGRNVLPKCW